MIRQLGAGQKVARVKCRYLSNSERIRTATSQLGLGILNVKEFLLQCSHSSDNYLHRELDWHTNVEQGISIIYKYIMYL